VLLLIGRFCASSNESFIAAMQQLPHVTLIGDTTGGATANAQTFLLGGGWSYTVSRWIEYTVSGQVIEDQGIAPSVPIQASAADFQKRPGSGARLRDRPCHRSGDELSAARLTGGVGYRSDPGGRDMLDGRQRVIVAPVLDSRLPANDAADAVVERRSSQRLCQSTRRSPAREPPPRPLLRTESYQAIRRSHRLP
jgi:Peptidase family S41